MKTLQGLQHRGLLGEAEFEVLERAIAAAKQPVTLSPDVQVAQTLSPKVLLGQVRPFE